MRVSILLALSLFAIACSGSPTAPTTDPSSVPPPGTSGGPPPSASSCTPSVTGLPTLPTRVPREGGSFPFEITIASGCDWTAETDVTWATVTPGAGQGNSTPTLSVDKTPRIDGRTLFVTVGSQSFRVVQELGCSYSLDPASLDLSGEGGSATIDLVATLDQCVWTATSSEEWIRVLTPSGTGSGEVRLDVDHNPSDVRHMFLTIAGIRVDVTQQRR